METYDVDTAPEPNGWLELDEASRIALVELFHIELGEEMPSVRAHASMHVAVENQLAMGMEGVVATYKRLMREGLDRHNTIHAIGAVLAEEIYSLTAGKSQAFEEKRYNRRLGKLSAKRWMRGKW